jgi:large subunit ribosomal protein L14e
MFSIGRICVKVAGRDSNLKCVVVEALGKGYVLIDGQTRRKKCNILHLEPTQEMLEIKKSASHEDVVAAFKSLGIEIAAKKAKTKGAKPSVKRKVAKAEKPKAAKPKK